MISHNYQPIPDFTGTKWIFIKIVLLLTKLPPNQKRTIASKTYYKRDYGYEPIPDFTGTKWMVIKKTSHFKRWLCNAWRINARINWYKMNDYREKL